MISSGKIATELEDEFLGKIAKAETNIGPGQDGKVEFHGTSWNARSASFIEKGDKVTIIGNESILLIVQPSSTIS
jgi:membrane-bound ClpP family serine protease